MARALELAGRAERGRVSPNPLVGAVIARGEAAIGYRLRDGTVHVNPPKSVPVALGPRVDVIVIGRFH